jgi:broad specificity phosphatase PhoE
MDSILDRHHHGDVLVVTHGGLIQARCTVVGRSSRGIFAFRIQNASVSVIERRNGRPWSAASTTSATSRPQPEPDPMSVDAAS